MTARTGRAEPPLAAPDDAPAEEGYGKGARILSIGIASTGLVTFAYFSVASHVVDDDAYGAITLLWSILFVTISVIYRPVEQLLARTIADRRARGLAEGHPLRGPLGIQASFTALFLVVAFACKGPLEDAFDSSGLFWIFIGAALAYAASYFARGYFAGHQWFGLYGGLVLFESLARVAFPLAAAVGIASGATFVALGILAAPFASLLVIPVALRRHTASTAPPEAASEEQADSGRGFAVAVAGVQLAEQALLNAAVLIAPGGGVVFSAFLITRAPLQLFQSVQTSLLPHLAGLEATEGSEAFGKAIRITLLAIAAFAGAVALGLLVVGPPVMDVVFDTDEDWGRVGLAVIALGMGAHLAAGTLNQAALARGRATAAAVAWLTAAAVFVAWMALGLVSDELLRAEVGYLGATLGLALALGALYRTGSASARAAPTPPSPA